MNACRFVVFALGMDFFDLEIDSRVREVLLDLESLNEREKYWNVSRSIGVLLSTFVKMLNARMVLEIGTSSGYSGILLAEALSHTGGMLYTVESHAKRFEVARDSFERAGIGEFVTQVKGHAPEILEEIDADVVFDMVFLDATKMEYQQYLHAVLPRLRKGGLIVADNIASHQESVQPFVEEVERTENIQHFFLPLDSGLLLCFKDS